MIQTVDVKNHLKKLLLINESYADSFNFNIENFLDLNGDSDNNNFYSIFESLKELESWLDLVKSKIVMHDEDEQIEEIIAEYVDLIRYNKKSLNLISA